MAEKAVDAGMLLDTIFYYKAIKLQQLLLMFPGKENVVQGLLVHFEDHRRVLLNQDRSIVACNEEWLERGNPRCELALWVLLDFWDKVEFHLPGTDGVTITAYTSEGEYDLIVVDPGEEPSVCEWFERVRECLSERIILILKSASQISSLPQDGIRAFCVVDADGRTIYYTNTKGDTG